MFASNVPISRPINTITYVDGDFGGICWSKQQGLVFKGSVNYDYFDLPSNKHRSE
jgi:hypothetical protein|nr:MAG TPA: hypothetical protein [Caudoviricetes sp.]DAQ26236.1 MAG TPA: hypothetical protein [Caudoviricetes sp.]DAS10546.1 MAG TPA: hypothetical protein [Caudoviricetes sp.]DAT58243.1 MAG TPA: hypothetical protein [Caudoviricetes sp.]DAX46662.1 MAG TPA: hypothetical protein [Bacteriophage sp.]